MWVRIPPGARALTGLRRDLTKRARRCSVALFDGQVLTDVSVTGSPEVVASGLFIFGTPAAGLCGRSRISSTRRELAAAVGSHYMGGSLFPRGPADREPVMPPRASLTRSSRRPSTRAVLLAGCLLTLACDREHTGPDSSPLRFLSGDGLVDTALAAPTTPLVAQVLDEEGRPAVGVVARFEGLPEDSGGAATMSVFPMEGESRFPFVFDTADVLGRVSARVRMGTKAGAGRVQVSIFQRGLVDTATYTILPGAAAGVTAVPMDTALYVAASYDLGARLVDQHGNRRPEAPPFQATALDPAVTIEGTGRVVGQQFGRGRMVISAQTFTDTAFVSVVPIGTLAVYRPPRSEGDTAGTLLVELDLSNRRYLEFTVGEPAGARSMDWSPSGDRIVFDESAGNVYTLFTVGEDGQVERLITTGYGIMAEVWPQYRPDGAWIFYGARRSPSTGEIWRVRADGSEPERVGPAAADLEEDAQPSIAPDGRRVVYASDRVFTWELRILDLETGAVDSLGVRGDAPRWSPVADEIAYLGIGGIRLIQADGTGDRTVTEEGVASYGPPLDWSPDGAWLVVRRPFSGIEVIHVASGLTIPLPGTLNLHSPAWRP